MASQAELVIAFVFNRSGKTELSFSDMYLTLSMELNWFTPEDAKDFLEKAIEEKLLTKKDNQIRPSFDVSKINIPVGYVPKGSLFEKKKEEKQENASLLDQIVNKIAEDSKEDKERIYEEIRQIKEEKNIKKEIAALVLLSKYERLSDSLYTDIKKEIIK